MKSILNTQMMGAIADSLHKLKRVNFILFLFCWLSISNLMAERKDYTREEYNFMSECVDEIVTSLKTEMREQFGLTSIGRGGSMPYDIQSIGVDFLLNQQTSIEEARELEIKVTERFVELVNGCEKVRPYLRDYPWDYNRTEVMISFLQNNGETYSEGISLIFVAKGNIIYYGPKKYLKEDSVIIKREPYLEAKKIVDTSPSCLKPVQKKKKWFEWF